MASDSSGMYVYVFTMSNLQHWLNSTQWFIGWLTFCCLFFIVIWMYHTENKQESVPNPSNGP